VKGQVKRCVQDLMKLTSEKAALNLRGRSMNMTELQVSVVIEVTLKTCENVVTQRLDR
jgi:hypothetical protein